MLCSFALYTRLNTERYDYYSRLSTAKYEMHIHKREPHSVFSPSRHSLSGSKTFLRKRKDLYYFPEMKIQKCAITRAIAIVWLLLLHFLRFCKGKRLKTTYEDHPSVLNTAINREVLSFTVSFSDLNRHLHDRTEGTSFLLSAVCLACTRASHSLSDSAQFSSKDYGDFLAA